MLFDEESFPYRRTAKGKSSLEAVSFESVSVARAPETSGRHRSCAVNIGRLPNGCAAQHRASSENPVFASFSSRTFTTFKSKKCAFMPLLLISKGIIAA
jgi:hypothetical protein